jgi:hypothetical protein
MQRSATRCQRSTTCLHERNDESLLLELHRGGVLEERDGLLQAADAMARRMQHTGMTRGTCTCIGSFHSTTSCDPDARLKF